MAENEKVSLTAAEPVVPAADPAPKEDKSAVKRRESDSKIIETAVQMKAEEARKARAKKATKDDGEDLTKAYKTDSHTLSIPELEEKYNMVVKDDRGALQGIATADIADKLEMYGLNMLTPQKGYPWWVKLLICIFEGFFQLLLWFGAIFSFVAYGLIPDDPANLFIGFALTFVVTATGIFTYFQEKQSSDMMASFKEMEAPSCNCYRSGELLNLPAKQLVPGDLITLVSGDKFPADIVIVDCSTDAQVDNASLTGESEPQERKSKQTHDQCMETKNLAFFGTNLVKGKVTGIVINTGDRTLMGQIAALAATTSAEQTPIGKEIKAFVIKISFLAFSLGITLFILDMFRHNWSSFGTVGSVVLLIGIIVANVPEGLLATVTVSLTLTANRMAKKNVLVKHLEAVETLGSTSVICSDKTGTLTTNIMTVQHVFYDFTEFECDTACAAQGDFDPESPSFKKLTEVACLCSNAKVVAKKNEAGEDVEGLEIKGDASETAFLKFVLGQYGDPAKLQKFQQDNPKVHEIPFNSANKWQLSIHNHQELKKNVLVLKGAPEKCLGFCDRFREGGEVKPLDEESKKRIIAGIRGLSAKGERVLAFCRLELDEEKFPLGHAFEGDSREDVNFPFGRADEEGLVFVGLMAMIDPARPGVPEAVKMCQSAGIKVIMVTGDHPITAKAIARKVNIIKEEDLTRDEVAARDEIKPEEVQEHLVGAVVTHGVALENALDDTEDNQIAFWNRVLNKNSIVFARTSPQQKLLIVQACQQRGGIVAVTGDGVNDSPALRRADIGVAMNITGTDVAKDAADMVLIDDNFASIVKGVEEGRIIFDNLKKSIAYTLSSNIPEILPFILFALFGWPLPLSTIMILMVDLGTDILPAISMAHEGKEADIMKRPPRDPDSDNLVTWRLMSFSYLQIGLFQALAGLYTYMAVLNYYGLQPGYLTGLAGSSQYASTNTKSITNYQYLYSYRSGTGETIQGNIADSVKTTKADVGAEGQYWNPNKDAKYHVWIPKHDSLLYMAKTAGDPIFPAYWDCQTKTGADYDAYADLPITQCGADAIMSFSNKKCTKDELSNEAWFGDRFDALQAGDAGGWSETKELDAGDWGAQETFTGAGLDQYDILNPVYAARLLDASLEYNEDTSSSFREDRDVSAFNPSTAVAYDSQYRPAACIRKVSTTATDPCFATANSTRAEYFAETASACWMSMSSAYQNEEHPEYAIFGPSKDPATSQMECPNAAEAANKDTANCRWPMKAGLNQIGDPYGGDGGRRSILAEAQTAYFISIVVVQWADLMICKTRTLSIYSQGMRNSFMNKSLIFETVLAMVLAYMPGMGVAFGTKPVRFLFLLPAVPFSLCIFGYDELRKWWIRNNRYGWVERTTYW